MSSLLCPLTHIQLPWCKSKGSDNIFRHCTAVGNQGDHHFGHTEYSTEYVNADDIAEHLHDGARGSIEIVLTNSPFEFVANK